MRKLLNCKELIFLTNEKLSTWKEIVNISLSNLKNFFPKEDISIIKLGDIDQEKLKILKEILKENSLNINIFNSILECKESKNKLFISSFLEQKKRYC